MNEMNTVKNSNGFVSTLIGFGIAAAVAGVAFLLAFLYVQAALAAISYSLAPVLF